MVDFTVGNEASQNLQIFIKAIEPYGIKTPEGSALRKAGFSKADSNGSGMASLAELENFIKAALEEAHQDDEERAGDLFRLYRPCFIRAFSLAKNVSKGNGKVLAGAKTATADDYISFSEFRVFCVYLTIYAAMYDIFTMVDGENAGVTEEDDSRISLDEFVDKWQSLDGYGFKALDGIDSVEQATEIFNTIDSNNGGFILFKEWADYIKEQEIQAKTHIGTLLSGNLTATKISNDKPSASSSRGVVKDSKKSTVQHTPKMIVAEIPRITKKPSTERPKSRVSTGTLRSTASPRTAKGTLGSPSTGTTSNIKAKVKLSPTVDGAYKPMNTSKELKEFIKSFQPYTEMNDEAKKLRKMGFKKCDSNGTGQCSLAEIDGFILTNLKDDYGPKLGEKLFKLFRPSYIVAYNAAKNLKSSVKDNDDDYINFAEFRVLNVYLCIYAGMLDAFSMIDGGGSGVTEDDDRRVEKNEWMKGYIHVRTSGFIGLGRLADQYFALAAFKDMDANNSGKVLFRDFCGYLSAAEVDAGTEMGFLFSKNGLQLRSVNKVEEPLGMNGQLVEQDYNFVENEVQEEANLDIVQGEAEEVHEVDLLDMVPNDVITNEQTGVEVDLLDMVPADDIMNEQIEVENEHHEEEEIINEELEKEEEGDPNDDAEKNTPVDGPLEEESTLVPNDEITNEQTGVEIDLLDMVPADDIMNEQTEVANEHHEEEEIINEELEKEEVEDPNDDAEKNTPVDGPLEEEPTLEVEAAQ